MSVQISRQFQSVFQSNSTHLNPYQMWMRVPIAQHPP